jgi:hypothetical protein
MKEVRLKKLFLALLSSTWLAQGCVVVHSDPHPGGGVPTSAPISQIEVNKGLTFDPGFAAGYVITANTGGSFRMEWTGDSQVSATYREFWGSVWVSGGQFDSVTPGCAQNACPLESNDYVSDILSVPGGERVDWDTFATDGVDGFDFAVTPGATVYFDMFVDGTHDPALVEFVDAATGQPATAPALPFGLTM